MSAKLVTVDEFSSIADASVAQSILENEGINSFIDGDASFAVAFHLSAFNGGIKLQVSHSDEERAREILRDTRKEKNPAASAETGTVDEIKSERLAKAFAVAGMSVLVFPAALYAIWLLIRCARSKGTIREGKWRVWASILLCLPGMFTMFSIASVILFGSMIPTSHVRVTKPKVEVNAQEFEEKGHPRARLTILIELFSVNVR
ncbi:MAG: DUF2007 domain-containing protein [Planctomycetes bacterium]|nr:DUF2007 domain-containing protein [Planctomycetota bacterium]